MDELRAIVVALSHEAKGLLRHLSVRSQIQFKSIKIWEGDWGKEKVLLLQTGMGPERAGRAVRFLLEQYPVRSLLSTGYCGALQEGLKCGDAVVAATLHSTNPELGLLHSDPELLERAGSTLKSLALPAQVGGLLTAAKPLINKEEKSKWGRLSGCLAVDMESHAVHQAIQDSEKKIASLTVRFIVDGLSDEFGDYSGFVDEAARVHPLGLVQELIRRPKVALELSDFERKARIARSNLVQFIQKGVFHEDSEW